MFRKVHQDAPRRCQVHVDLLRGGGDATLGRRRLLKEAEASIVATVCKGLCDKYGVTTTVLTSVVKQVVIKCGVEMAISKSTVRRLLRDWGVGNDAAPSLRNRRTLPKWPGST